MAIHANANTELTKILGPLMTALIKFNTSESAEMQEAITRSGSDGLTELKLAALIGQLRIDEGIKAEFRRVVGASRQISISTFMQDLVLEAGAGPTVRQALTSSNPALLSMAVQISFLSFGHEHQSLAQSITQAIEETLIASNNSPHRGLDYVSVLGVVTACQQQTAAFRWSSFYESVEAKILLSMKENKNPKHQAKKRRTAITSAPELPTSVTNRGLSYVILKLLLIRLISVQDFPEHYLLQLSMSRGISSIVVWCYYVLGLSVKVTCGKAVILFGKEPYHIYVVECDSSRECATLLERLEQGEDLFTFSNSESDPIVVSEDRVEARGFAKKALALTEEDTVTCAHWLAASCMKHFDATFQSLSFGKLKSTTMESSIRENIVPSTLFLFDMTELNDDKMTSLLGSERRKGKQIADRFRWQPYVVLVYIFARISNRASCNAAPISLTAFRDIKKDDHGISRSNEGFTGPLPDILLSYELLARLLLGTRYSQGFIEKTCLLSAYGWSLFFDSFCVDDPSDLANGLLHLRLGVPTRLGSRRTRIVDGPSHTDLSSTSGIMINNERPTLAFWPSVWSGRYTGAYVGNHGSDAFSVVQHSEWARDGNKSKSWKFGFRERVESCRKWISLALAPATKIRLQRRIKLGLTLIY